MAPAPSRPSARMPRASVAHTGTLEAGFVSDALRKLIGVIVGTFGSDSDDAPARAPTPGISCFSGAWTGAALATGVVCSGVGSVLRIELTLPGRLSGAAVEPVRP